MSAEEGPILSLRLRSTRSCPVEGDNDDIIERVAVMRAQESNSSYQCQDYILRQELEPTEPASFLSNDCPALIDEEVVDSLCREKMCEWNYRVIDHFHASREIVAISMAYVDRFIDQCPCDRTSFKLAAMTSLYMATKLFNGKGLSMASLAELSRGEFEIEHIADMEGLILQTLSWRMHPPIVQDFINHFQALLPFVKGPVTKAIYQRAIFFAELAVFDYYVVTQPRSLLAVASILNSMEGMDESVVSEKDRQVFLEALQSSFNIDYSQEEIEFVRNRLWYIYSQSAQYEEDGCEPEGPQPDTHHLDDLIIEKDPTDGEISQSPISVSLVDHC